MGLYDKLLLKIKELQEKGVPLMWFKDPLTKLPSVSLTLMLISFTLVLFGLINKWAKIVEGIDVDSSTELFLITAGLYFGRSLSKKISEPPKE